MSLTDLLYALSKHICVCSKCLFWSSWFVGFFGRVSRSEVGWGGMVLLLPRRTKGTLTLTPDLSDERKPFIPEQRAMKVQSSALDSM